MHVHRISDNTVPSGDSETLKEIRDHLKGDTKSAKPTDDGSGFEPWQQKIIAEKKDLDARHAKLKAFIDSDAFPKLTESEKENVKEHELAMEDYSDALGHRIDNFEHPRDKQKREKSEHHQGDRESMSRLGDQGGEKSPSELSEMSEQELHAEIERLDKYDMGEADRKRLDAAYAEMDKRDREAHGVTDQDQGVGDVQHRHAQGTGPMTAQMDHRIPPNDEMSGDHLAAVEEQDRKATDLATTNQLTQARPDQGQQADLTGGDGMIKTAAAREVAEGDKPPAPKEEADRAEDRQKNAETGSGFNAAEQEHHDREFPDAGKPKPGEGKFPDKNDPNGSD